MNKRSAQLKRMRKKADAILQEINRVEHEHCETCGERNEVGHHFIRKRACADLRYDFENIVPLCTSCHTKHHMDSPCLNVAITRIRGDAWHDRLERLRLEAHGRLNTSEQTKTNIGYYLEIIEMLEARLERVMEGV